MHVSYQGKNGPDVKFWGTTETTPRPELDRIYALLCTSISEDGCVSSPRGKESKEIIDASFFLENPRNRVITSSVRKVKPRYLIGEWLWYLSGEEQISRVIKYSKFWINLQDELGNVNSNYGQKIFYGWPDKNPLDSTSQFSRVALELSRDPDSRRAIINIHTGEVENTKDVPCTLDLQFFIRDRKLHLSVNMRSNDLILGLCNDVFQFTMIQEMMLRYLQIDEKFSDLELGNYHHHAGSLHVYETSYDKMNGETIGSKSSLLLSQLAVMEPLPRFSSVRQMQNWINYLVNLETAYSSGGADETFKAVERSFGVGESFLYGRFPGYRPRILKGFTFDEMITLEQKAHADYLFSWICPNSKEYYTGE